jgi:hypothetical protein
LAAYSLDISVAHCAECAGFGYFPTATTKIGAGFTMCLKCVGKPTRVVGSYDWEPATRRMLLMQWRGYKKMDYVWHYVCGSCKHRFLDCLNYTQIKEMGLVPCCAKPTMLVHNEFSTACDCMRGAPL